MRKNRGGFTIVEVVITVAVIAILVSMAFFGYTQIQKDSRNTQRASKVKIIAEKLEAYYIKNGEYPSCSAMTQSASQVSTNTLKGIELDVLKTPLSPAATTNSIGCTALSAGVGTDTFAYVGDGSPTCSTGASCLQYTLQYRDENTGAIVSKDSSHRTQIAGSTASTLSATPISNTQINLSWTAINNVATYTLQRATDNTFTTNLVTASSISGTTSSASGLTPGQTYYFRVAGVATTGQTDWSNTASASTTISAPSGTPTMSAGLVSTNAVGTTTAVTCASGTVEYQIRFRSTNVNSTPSWSSWSSWGTSLTRTEPASQGYQYEFQSQARCTGPSISSSTSSQSNIPAVVRAISTPAAPTYLSPSFFDSPNHALVNFSGSCPSGTNTISTTFRSKAWTGANWGPNPWGFDDWWTNNTGSNKTVEYWGKYQCQTYFSTSAISPESYNVITVTP
jgi:prepilin-type N-terminal cleavage/methylation domain-containing protein